MPGPAPWPMRTGRSGTGRHGGTKSGHVQAHAVPRRRLGQDREWQQTLALMPAQRHKAETGRSGVSRCLTCPVPGGYPDQYRRLRGDHGNKRLERSYAAAWPGQLTLSLPGSTAVIREAEDYWHGQVASWSGRCSGRGSGALGVLASATSALATGLSCSLSAWRRALASRFRCVERLGHLGQALYLVHGEPWFLPEPRARGATRFAALLAAVGDSGRARQTGTSARLPAPRRRRPGSPRCRYTSDVHVHNAVGSEYSDMH